MQVHPNMRSVFVTLIKDRGFQGLYAGLIPTLVEIIPYVGFSLKFMTLSAVVHGKVLSLINVLFV